MLLIRFVIPLDIDEIIFPINHTDWKSLLDRILLKQHGLLDQVASFAVQNSYFFQDWSFHDFNNNNTVAGDNNDDDNDHPSFFSFKYRTGNFSQIGHSVKSFVNTKVARSLFNHYALSVLHPQQKFVVNLKEDMVQLNHYKMSCSKTKHSLEQCKNIFLSSKVEDTRFIREFGPRVIHRREQVLKELVKIKSSPLQNITETEI